MNKEKDSWKKLLWKHLRYEGRIVCRLLHKKYWDSFATGKYIIRPSFNSVVYYHCSRCDKLRTRTFKNYSKFIKWLTERIKT